MTKPTFINWSGNITPETNFTYEGWWKCIPHHIIHVISETNMKKYNYSVGVNATEYITFNLSSLEVIEGEPQSRVSLVSAQ